MRLRERGRLPIRRGAILIAVMVALGLASALVLSMVKLTAVERKLLRQQCHHHQADWLCVAGANRARQAVLADDTYVGENWVVSAAELGRIDDGVVTISVTEGAAGNKVVSVVARYPAKAVHAVQLSRSFRLNR